MSATPTHHLSTLPGVDALKALLGNLQARQAGWQQAQQLMAAQLAPDFSPFSVYRSHEVDVSRHLALLLDPNETHGQGSLFWDAWVDLVLDAQGKQHLLSVDGEDDKAAATEQDLRADDGEAVDMPRPNSAWLRQSVVGNVETEHSTSSLDKRRYIDLCVHLQAPNGMLAIENKPWYSSVDEEGQLADYAKHLSQLAKGRPWLLVYLGRGAPGVQSISLAERTELTNQGHLVCVSWSQMLQMFRQCVPKIQASKVRWFVEDFIDMLEEETMGYVDEKELAHVAQAFNNSPQALAQALLLRDTLLQWQSSRLELLKEQLNKRFVEEGVKPQWGINTESPHKRKAYFALPFTSSPDVTLRFEWYFGFADEENFYWGLHIPSFDKEAAKGLGEALIQAAPQLPASDDVEEMWPFWVYLTDDPLFTPDAKQTGATTLHPWLSVDRHENDFVTLVLQRYRELKAALQSDAVQVRLKQEQ
ncbi:MULTISPECIES: PD-(D/E)XK nuclease family protein [Comamonas]|uniref:PDDEXK-like family protein n=1 Tax=Comamonas TaxID=283 RepID=UPI000A7D64DC|nr:MULTISPECIES: PD-(D/E)XK nuclease family protein [Comamonas]QOQ80399.1 PD-(D/E)XK nuclease family protein [Comamonas thiooxydans]